MKKLSTLFLGLLMSTSAFAQLSIQSVSANEIKLTYGATNDYTIYDPGFEVPTFYVHCWSNAADNSTGVGLEDAWTNSTVMMNWDATAMAYVGTINLRSKIFTNTNNSFPVGTVVNNLGFVFKDMQNGATKQSGDLKASDYGFTSTTIMVLATSNNTLSKKSAVANGKLYSAIKGDATISVYEMTGKMVKNFQAKSNGNAIDLNIVNNGIYLVKITNGTQTEVVKFVK